MRSGLVRVEDDDDPVSMFIESIKFHCRTKI